MFHIELRQFPHVTRAFNLSKEELDARILAPWLAGRPVELDERRWMPEKAKLSIYEGPELATAELGLGRGWASVTRSGQEVTERVLEQLRAPPVIEEFKAELLSAAASRIAMPQLIELARERYPQWRASERLALAEEAVWALLHQQRLLMLEDGAPVASDRWQAVLLAWETWTGDAVTLAAV